MIIKTQEKSPPNNWQAKKPEIHKNFEQCGSCQHSTDIYAVDFWFNSMKSYRRKCRVQAINATKVFDSR
jgi:hypothetical protein